MENELTALVICAMVAFATLCGLVFAVRLKQPPVLLDHDTRAHDKLFTPVEHHGAEEGWSPAEEVAAEPHPLDTSVPLTFGDELVPAHLFADVHAFNPVALDYPPISFTQEWALAGQRLAEMGDTQAMPKVAA